MANTKNQIAIPEIAAEFPVLTASQYRLLGFCAYNGTYPPNPWTVTLYDGQFNIPNHRTEKDCAALKEAGLLKDNHVLPADYFRITIPLIRHFPEWVSVFEEFGKYRSDKLVYLWKMAKCFAKNDMRAASSLRYPHSDDPWEYFESLLFNPEYGEILSLLPRKSIEMLLASALENAYDAETLNTATLGEIREMAEIWLTQPDAILDRADAYEYYLTGKLPKEKASNFTMWSQGVRAIDLLIKGNLGEAMESFFRARSLVPEGFDEVYPDRLLTWFYTLCLIRNKRKYHSQRVDRALEKLKKSSGFLFVTGHMPTMTLLTHMESKDKNYQAHVTGEIRQFLEKDHSKIGKLLALTVLKYFRISDIAVEELHLDPKSIPTTLILKNEMTPFVPMASVEKQHLQELYGGPSVVGTVPRKETWEMALSDLTEFVTSSQDENQIEKRIIYFLDDKWITAILEQSRIVGEDVWGKEKLLSRSQLLRGGYDSMDVLDLKLARALANKVIDRPDSDVVIPILAGTGRVFTGQHYRQPYTSLPIQDEAPFVAFSGNGGSILVSSNVQRRQDGTIPPVSIIKNGNEYTCIRTNPVQRDILVQLLEVGSFPANALPAIRRTIDSLEGMLEVRSSLSGMAVIPTLRGSARLDLRISPLKEEDGYGMEISAAPYEEGDLRCEPGQGAEDVYDDTGGEPRFIHRDIQLEYDNFSELSDYIKNELELESEDDYNYRLYASESLLGILTWAYDNRDKCFVEWPEGQALRFRGEVKSNNVDITVKSGVNWFEVEGEIFIGKDKYNLEEILKAMKESDVKGYVKLGDKDYVRMTKTLQKHLEAIDEMMSAKVGKNQVVPIYRVGHLAKILGDEGGLHGTMDEGFKNLLNKMQEAYDTTPEVPSTLKATLRDYQKEGYVWMKRLDVWGAGACLADDMGLGKTVQTLAFILSKADEGPSLVVAPKSVVPNWDIETARFAPSLNVTVLNDVSKREDCIAAAGPRDLILATYGVLTTENEVLSSKKWNVICLDEAHQIKNRNTRVSAAAMSLEGTSRIILTGTPIQNHLGELWNLFQFINPGLLGQWTDFKARYLHGEMDEGHREFLRDLVQPFILRRTKEEVLDELPEKIVYEQMVELSPEEMQVYEALRKYVEDRVGSDRDKKATPDGDEPIKIDFFAELTKLRLASLSLSLIYDDWKLGSSKTDALMGLLDQISAVEGNQVVVFSQFTSYLAQVKAMLDRKGLRYLYLDGQTDLDERREVVEQFQNGDCPLFLASLKAGGLGLNLTAANYVILLDPWWNPAIESQAMDRAHRIGQMRTVTVIRLIARHTIEEKILRLHETKLQLSEEMLDGTAYSGKLTMDDVLEMVSPFR